MSRQYTSSTTADSVYSLLEPDEATLVARAIDILESKLLQSEIFSSPDMVKRYCQLQLASERDEVFCCLFLTSQHQLIAFEKIFFGTIDGASVHPRIVMRRVLELNAAAVIFTHNHPSGISEPSTADQQITHRLKESLSLIDVRVLDHIVVGCTDSISMAELAVSNLRRKHNMEIIGIVLIAAGVYWYSSRPSFIAQRLWYSIMKSQGVVTKDELITKKTGLKYYYKLRGRGLSSEQIFDMIIQDITPEEEHYLSGIKIWCEEYNQGEENFTMRDIFGEYIEFWETQVNAIEFGQNQRN